MNVILAVPKHEYEEIGQKCYIFDSWQSLIKWAKKVSDKDKDGGEGSYRLSCDDSRTELYFTMNANDYYFSILDKEVIEI